MAGTDRLVMDPDPAACLTSMLEGWRIKRPRKGSARYRGHGTGQASQLSQAWRHGTKRAIMHLMHIHARMCDGTSPQGTIAPRVGFNRIKTHTCKSDDTCA